MNRPSEAEWEQWNEEGYLVIEDALIGEELDRLQKAHTYWGEQCKDQWLDAVEAGDMIPNCFDIPDPFSKDEIFVDIVDHPSYYGYLLDFTDNNILFLAPQVRAVPPWPISYTRWHADSSHGRPLHIKVQVYVYDVDEAGAFGFVPGSHKEGSDLFRNYHHLKSMPGHKPLPGKAGTAIIFNSRGLHSAMDNPSSEPRRSVILIYDKNEGQSTVDPRFEKISHLCTTPERRRLFQLEI